jgi:hypothetical protein
MSLSVAQTVQLYAAYVRYRFFLQENLGMSPGELVFHYPLLCPEELDSLSEGGSLGSESSGGSGRRQRRQSLEVKDSDVNSTGSLHFPHTPVTPQYAAVCSSKSKKRVFSMIYSESVSSEALANR